MFGRSRARRRVEFTPLIMDVVQAALKGRGLPLQFELDDPLSTAGLGFDSMDILELLRNVEVVCNVRIPEKFWGTQAPQTVNDVINVAARFAK